MPVRGPRPFRFSTRLIPLPTLALLLLCACDTFPAQEAIGAALAPDGRPEIVYVGCPGETVERVRVVRPVDNPGGDNDAVLWAITRTSPGPTAPESFVVGADPPAGFTESVPLAHRLPSNVALTGLVDTDGTLEVAVPFRASNLQIDRIRTFDGQYITPTNFRQSAQTRCKT